MSDEIVTPAPYRDEDLVYVDPDARAVVGHVEWSKTGNPKPMALPPPPVEVKKEKGERRRGSGRKFYPWGTYRSMKHVYHLEGKPKKSDGTMTLEDALQRALKEAFWD